MIKQRTQQQVMKLWVKALRSGEYKQANRVLRSSNRGGSHCCLGVLCDLASRDGGPEWNVHSFMGSSGFLSPAMKKWIKLVYPKFDQGELIDMNDNERKTFIEIADHIEAKYIKAGVK